jgi:predicted site-specific integrase-resolvase
MEHQMIHVVGESRLVNETEAARMLGISVKTMRRWRWAGQGPVFTKLGGAVRYGMGDLEAFIEAGRRQSTAEVGRAA